jgi:hydroxymethylpyrimidine pyrophosphatase-like HAD family hydrolase
MKTICVDIDGTLTHFEEWKGDFYFGKVLPGAAEAMRNLRQEGWYIIIYTTRGNRNAVKEFLDANQITYDAINENPFQPDNAKDGKLLADVYIDDRAITFDGNWSTALSKIKLFKPWES